MASTPTSIQERLQLKRVPLDDWSIREKLGLATAVLCSGDQNWMSVSRALKIFGDTTRPADWFSQKSCAAQYGKLLENVETPKRKKRTLSERDSSTPVETPGESIVRKLTQERISELQRIMLEEQQEFQKLRDEIVVLQSPHVSEEQIREMVAQIEEEKRQNEIEKANHAEFLRKREQRKIEIERAWRPGLISKNASLLKQQQQQQQQQLKSGNDESVDTDDTCSRSSTGQSPLLTSLLKSPSSTPNLTLLQQSSIQSSPTTNVVASESYISVQSTTQVSASQAAPTLSMLLDGGKASENTSSKHSASIEAQLLEHQDSLPDDQSIDIFPEQIPSVESTDNTNDPKDDEQLLEVFKGLIPDNIDELADILTENNALLNPELLEGEEMLDEVMNQEEAQHEQELDQPDISKMDTFDQLKHETMLEERSKREAAALKAMNEGSSGTLNISPEDSNQEDDLPLRVLQKDIQEANKAKQAQELTFQVQENSKMEAAIRISESSNTDVINLDESSIPESLSTEQPEVEQSEIEENLQKPEHSILNPNVIESIEDTNESSVKTEIDEKMDLEFEDKPLPGTIPIIKTELEDSSVDEAPMVNIKNSEAKTLSDDEEIFEDAKETITPEKTQKPLIADTDEESVTDAIAKDESKTRARRDYTRKRQEPDTPTKFEKSFKQESDRSDSPLILDDDSDNAPRTRRRYSSTPVSDSVPNSPASIMDDKELKAWRKLILLAYGRISSHKNAAVFGYLSNKDSQDKKHKDLILRPMDMTTIKKNIENGVIKTTTEFQRDIMLMCTNIMLVTPSNSSINQQAKEMMAESISIIKVTMDGCKDKEVFDKGSNVGSSSTANKRGSRKSLRGT